MPLNCNVSCPQTPEQAAYELPELTVTANANAVEERTAEQKEQSKLFLWMLTILSQLN